MSAARKSRSRPALTARALPPSSPTRLHPRATDRGQGAEDDAGEAPRPRPRTTSTRQSVAGTGSWSPLAGERAPNEDAAQDLRERDADDRAQNREEARFPRGAAGRAACARPRGPRAPRSRARGRRPGKHEVGEVRASDQQHEAVDPEQEPQRRVVLAPQGTGPRPSRVDGQAEAPVTLHRVLL